METIEISGRRYTEEKIVKEKEEYVRLEAVDMCFALHKLAHDSSSLVRTAVARKKVAHDVLVNDDSWKVRATVAKYTDNSDILDQLINDPNDFVRYNLVKRSYRLEAFVNDPDEEIASTARYQLQNQKTA